MRASSRRATGFRTSGARGGSPRSRDRSDLSLPFRTARTPVRDHSRHELFLRVREQPGSAEHAARRRRERRGFPQDHRRGGHGEDADVPQVPRHARRQLGQRIRSQPEPRAQDAAAGSCRGDEGEARRRARPASSAQGADPRAPRFRAPEKARRGVPRRDSGDAAGISRNAAAADQPRNRKAQARPGDPVRPARARREACASIDPPAAPAHHLPAPPWNSDARGDGVLPRASPRYRRLFGRRRVCSRGGQPDLSCQPRSPAARQYSRQQGDDARLRRRLAKSDRATRARSGGRYAGLVRPLSCLALARARVRGVFEHRLDDPAMSLINKMLRDLDKRHAAHGGTAAPAEGLSRHMRSVPERTLASDFFWRTMAMTMLFAVGWVAWLVWQLTPHSVVTDLVYQSPRGKIPAPQPAPTLPAASSSAPVSASAQATLPQRSEKVNVDMLRLATELTTPIPQRSLRTSSSRSGSKTRSGAAKAVAEQPALAGDPAAAPGKIDRRSNTSSRNRAESEFRRAVSRVNPGRIAEGMDGFRRALEIDPGHEAARQTLVALLLETKRVDEAAVSLQEGLALNTGNTGFAMLLARIMVESNDIPTALFVLQRHPAPPDRNPDFHAFAAALYQRLDRHKEAIEQYQTALGLVPSAGVWWLGLGISFQAVGRPKDALEAFTRAKSAGNLAPDLLGFVEQRLRQLQ